MRSQSLVGVFVLVLGAIVASSTSRLVAQSAPCHVNNDTPSFTDTNSMGGPNLLLGMKTTAPTTYVATRIEVFTGEQRGVNSIALWSHDAANNRPLAPLTTASWSMSRANTWQGANLTTPIVVTGGQDLWVVWAPINGAQSSIETGGAVVTYRGSFDGGATWNGPFSGPWKFRIWCGPTPHYEVYGSGCPGTNGRVPEFNWTGLPILGGSVEARLDRALAGTSALLTIGTSDTVHLGVSLPFSLASLGAGGCQVLAAPAVTMFALVDSTGHAAVPIGIPLRASLAGVQFFDQWFVLDPSNALGLVTSDAGRGLVGG